MPEIIRAADRASFKRCRRAWDLGSRSRQNFEPVVPDRVVDLDRALHDAFALWYFPGMWEWDRGIVRRLTMEGYEKSMRRQLNAYAAVADVSEAQELAWEAARARGEAVLNRYLTWAPGVDAFSPVRVDTDFDANVPDPATPGLELVGPRGPIHFQGRIDALVVDAYDAYWIVDHRIVDGRWEDLNQLLLDEQGVAACWAWEIYYYGMKIAGTLYNEVRLDAPEIEIDAAAREAREGLSGRRRMYMEAARIPDDRVEITGNEAFRRTRITRTRAELAACGLQVAQEVTEMTSAGLVTYPNPSVAHCAPCAYREPCLAINMGLDPGPVLEARYRDRGPDEPEEGRLGGSTWSMNRGARPPRFPGA